MEKKRPKEENVIPADKETMIEEIIKKLPDADYMTVYMAYLFITGPDE